MLAKSFQVPDAPRSAGRLIEASFALWLASWRACLGESLLYGVASLLPLLVFSELEPAIAQALLGLSVDASLPWVPPGLRQDPADLIDAVRAWLVAPRTWIMLGMSMLGVFAALSILIHRQHGIAHGKPRAWADATRAAISRIPAGVGACGIYLAILLALTFPLAFLAGFVFGVALGMDLFGLLGLLVVFLLGSVMLSVPLAWASVAYGFAPLAAVADGDGALASQRRSARRVRGHWVHAAVVMSVPMLMYLGAAGAISSVTMMLCAAASYATGGWTALMSLDWLNWSYALALVPGAAILPLLTAGGVLVWHDLDLRGQQPDKSD